MPPDRTATATLPFASILPDSSAASAAAPPGSTTSFSSRKANATAATAGESKSGEGAAKQDEAKNTAGQKASVDLPEPEVRGFWGRIIGRIKRWAKQKAAELFGWIQEKIANVILKGLCGVSMADLKAYSGALKNQQNAAKTVADTLNRVLDRELQIYDIVRKGPALLARGETVLTVEAADAKDGMTVEAVADQAYKTLRSALYRYALDGNL